MSQLLTRHRQVAELVALETDRAALGIAVEADWHDGIACLERVARSRDLTAQTLDAILAIGEIVSSRVLTSALRACGLPAVWFDARRLLDEEHGAARPDMAATGARLRAGVQPLLAAGNLPVIGGFIGATTQGATTTLGRGGSDHSAAIVGALLGAMEIQIWTDVDGMLTADPRVITGTRPVATLSFAEAYDLAYFGAKVLHPSTIAPAAAAGIPLRILNSYRPEQPGTMIVESPPCSPRPISALACRRDATVIDLTRLPAGPAPDFQPRVLDLFARYRTPVEIIQASDTRLSVMVDETRQLAAIISVLREWADVRTEREMALLCAVGERLRTDPSLLAQIRTLLQGFPVRWVHQGSRPHAAVVLPQAQLSAAMALIHTRLCLPPNAAGASSDASAQRSETYV